MLTFQEFMQLAEVKGESAVFEAVKQWKLTETYRKACIAKEYFDFNNVTIKNFQKFLYNLKGQKIPDIYSADYKLRSNFFNDFVVQLSSYMVGNGVFLVNNYPEAIVNNKQLLGKNFDNVIYKALDEVQIGGCCFLFWDFDRLRVYSVREFAPLYDENTGALAAGIRFFRNGETQKFIVYDAEGVQEIILKKGPKGKANITVLEKRAYIQEYEYTEADGKQLVGERNYDGRLPIFVFWYNTQQTRLEGLRENIDCYDLIKSGLGSDLDWASLYWIIKGAGGMSDDVSLAQFIERMKLVKAANLPEGAEVESHKIDIPDAARKNYLEILENDLYRDAHAVNTRKLAQSGNVTATAIRFSYQPLDELADAVEMNLLETLQELFDFLGIDDTATFKRNRIVNITEETSTILDASEYLSGEMIIKKLPFLTPEEVEQALADYKNKNQEQNKAGFQ